MAPQFLLTRFIIDPVGVLSAEAAGAPPPDEAGRPPSNSEELDVSRELIVLELPALGVWKGSRAKVTPVTHAQPSFRSRRLMGERRRLTRRFAALGQTR